MDLRNPIVGERIAMLRTSGVPVLPADERRIEESVSASLKALDAAVRGSLFDTEPQTFDVVLRKLSKAVRS